LFDKGFSLYRYPDDWGRVVAFEAGRFRVNKYVGQFHGGKISYERFKELAKVKVYDEAVEREFDRLFQLDSNQAADYIGKNLADKAHLLYGNANHPPGWGGVKGRVFGQFGTFPVQYLNFLTEGLSRGTAKDRMEFFTIHSALNMGTVYAGSSILGADLQSWMTFGSLTYTGGPYAEAAISLVQMMGGSDAEKALASRNLQMMFPTFNSPQSIFVPGSYFIGDLQDAMQSNNIQKVLGEAVGVNFLQPGERTSVDKAFGFIEGIAR
jgi:hypothetical protein